jgi:hypothetical protein
MNRFLLAPAALVMLLVSQTTNAATTYTIQNYQADQNGATVTGTITTDGTLGVITVANILKWTWTISAHGLSSFTLSSSDPGAATSGCFVATSTNLTLPKPLPGVYCNSLLLSDVLNYPNVGELLWARIPISGGEKYGGQIPNPSGTGNVIWSTVNPAMGGTDPWVIASVQGPLLYTVTDANELAAVDVSVKPLASGTTIIGVTQDTASGPVRRIRGLAYDDGNNIMYGMTREGDLVTVDILTGKTTPLLSFGTVGDFWSGLAFDGTTKLYTTNASGTQQLAEIDLVSPGIPSPAQFKGSTTFSGIGLQILGLDFYPSSAPVTPPTFNGADPAPGVLYGSDRNNDNIVVVNAVNGLVTMPLGNETVGVPNLQEIAFHPQSGELFAIHDHSMTSNNAALSIYNFTTEMSTELGELPFGIVETLGSGGETYGWGGLAFAPNLCVSPPSDMVAWYPFDETVSSPAGTAAEIALSNTGIYAGGPGRIAGKAAGGLHFDGINDFVQSISILQTNFGKAGNNVCTPSPGCTGDLSIDAWIRLQPTAPNSVMTIVDKRDALTGVGYSLFLSFKRLGLQLNDGNGFDNYVSLPIPTLTDGEWHHVAVTVDRRNGNSANGANRWFHNGAPVGPQGKITQMGSLANTSPLRIGARTASTPLTGWFQGDIDELEIFNRELNPGEVSQIFSAQYFGKCK